MHKRKGMTLVELVIVIVILGLFMTTLFSTYKRINDLRTRIGNTANIQTQLLTITQVLNNTIQSHIIDYSKYATGELANNAGLTDTLHLTNGTDNISIYGSGNCQATLASGQLLGQWARNNSCTLTLKHNNTATPITDPATSIITHYTFKVTPIDQADVLFSQDNAKQVTNQGVWLFIEITAKNYLEDRPYKVQQNSQQFFNIP